MAYVKKPKSKMTAKKEHASGPRELMLHPDLHSARRQRIASYRAQTSALKNANSALKKLEAQDIPCFRQWLGEMFSEEYKRIGLLRIKLEELEMLQGATVDYQCIVGGTYYKAFAKVSEAHLAGILNEMMQDLIKEDEDNENFEVDEEDIEDAFKASFREIFELEEETFEDEWIEPKNQRQTSNEYIKELYRQLARKLHPDFNREQSAEEKSLWHNLQEAYHGNDIDRLEEIHRRMNGQGSAGINLWVIALGDLAAMTKDIEMKLRAVNKQISREKKEDYWDFARRCEKKGFLTKISSKIRKSMKLEYEALEMMIFEIQLEIERWRIPPKSSKSRTKNKKNKQPAAIKTKPTRKAGAQKDF